MLQSLLIINWLVFATMAASALLYKNQNDYQILGVTLSRKHAKDPDVEKIVKNFKIQCYLILLLSVGLSLLLMIRAIESYAEFYMLALIMANLFANWQVIHFNQKKLLALKKQNAWVYPQTRVVTVDTNVSKEKGSSSVAPVWIWLFFLLSFAPVIFLMINKELRDFYPLGFSFIGPLCQISTVFLYYQMRKQHTPVLSDDTEINKACAAEEERIHTTAATLSALIMLVFWILFNISLIYIRNSIAIVLPIAILVVGLLIIANWQQKKIRAAENTFFGEILKEDGDLSEQDSIWKWGCYYNPNDPRVMVPKRIAGMGWTINIGSPVGKAIGIGTLVLLLAVLGTVFYGGAKDYSVTENGSRLVIDAAMYSMSIDRDQVISVSEITEIPEGIRTNGYGGVNKSFGHFSLDGYGKCMLYVYNNVDEYIVLKLDGENPGYVIVNDKSLGQTKILYQTISQWAVK